MTDTPSERPDAAIVEMQKQAGPVGRDMAEKTILGIAEALNEFSAPLNAKGAICALIALGMADLSEEFFALLEAGVTGDV